MSTKFQLGAILAVGALSLVSVFGCVADRPSRNGVFNENQYLRKAWLIRPGDSTSPDNGWMIQATVTQASEPNVFGDADTFGLYAGSHNFGDLVHFIATSDKMQMVSNREISSKPTIGREAEVMNSWPITNVDLKYRINLDGEKTNFFEENQELDWQQRQWVKINLDKNDVSDLAPLGAYYNANVANCSDIANAAATLVPGSFFVDEPHDYAEWSIQVTLPLKFSADCAEAFGPQGMAAARLGREYQTITLKYSMTRAAAQPTYTPLVVGETDPIQKKYGFIPFISEARDPTTGLLASNQYVVRFDPTKEIKWYFENGFPMNYMPYFTSKNLPAGTQPLQGITTIEDATNQLFKDAGAGSTVSFHQYNEPLADGTPISRTYGDVRFNMLRWMDSPDQQDTGADGIRGGGFVGVTGWIIDPRTGEALASDITFENFAIKDYYAARLDAYLQTIGESTDSPFNPTPWPDPPTVPDPNNPASMIPVQCTASNVGASVPFVSKIAVGAHNGGSTLFQKIQQYLYKPVGQYGPLGPQDFIMDHTQDNNDFYNAYFGLLPYLVYGDPVANPYVTPESGSTNTGPQASANVWAMIHQEQQLHQLQSDLDHGIAPFDVNGASGATDARAFLDKFQAMTTNHRNLKYMKAELPYMAGVGIPLARQDSVTDFAMETVISKDARHCVQGPNGPKWETKEDWVNSLTNTYWSQVFWHEFGHSLGLDHNFMASVDKPNFPAPITQKNPDGTTTTKYPLYASSVMEYNAIPDRVFWKEGWGPYDKGAISWLYANKNGNPANVPPAQPPAGMTAKGISGQITPNYPWIDPNGFCKAGDTTCTAGAERAFLFCDAKHMKYTPLCRQGDMGTTPSEITANEIDAYEWQYKWRNFRQYRKFWNDANYGDSSMEFTTELRRFISLWAYDMGASELTTRFGQIGITPPPGAPAAQFYFSQLSEKFADEMAHAGAMSAAFHEAIIQQSSGQRPYKTVFDNFFGNVTQQGIILDKLVALQSFLGLWQVDNYDQTQSAGAYIASYSTFGQSFNVNSGTGIGALYQTIAEQGILSMLGGTYASFAYTPPLGVAQFVLDTHSINFVGANASPTRQEVQDWTGGWLFHRQQDMLDFFRNIAVQNGFTAQVGNLTIDCTTDMDHCNYDPTVIRGFAQDTFLSDGFNEFRGPDGRRYIWIYLRDRNQYFVADRDRNVASYTVMRNYTGDIINFKDDGNFGPAYSEELQLKYYLDYFTQSSSYTP